MRKFTQNTSNQQAILIQGMAAYRQKKHRHFKQQKEINTFYPEENLSEYLDTAIDPSIEIDTLSNLVIYQSEDTQIDVSEFSEFDSSSDSFIDSEYYSHTFPADSFSDNEPFHQQSTDLIETNCREKLQKWTVDHRSHLTVETVEDLLKILRVENIHNLPKSAVTLMHTKSNKNINLMNSAKNTIGYFMFLGIEQGLKNEKLSKMSLIPGVLWKSFEIVLIKEAKSYEQGLRHMIRPCSEFVVQSSNFEDLNSSEEESALVKLSNSELKASLKDISSFKEHESFVSFKVKKRRSSCCDEESNDSLSSSPKIKTYKCNPERKNQMVKNSSMSHENSRKSLNENKIKKKDVILNPNYKYCPTCGCAAKNAPASKANLESARRSIEYRIREKAKITRALFSVHNNTYSKNYIRTDN
ncbi:uncharacterized protein LOC105846626 isoform X3 [Hydra vulgaris]|uniref:uncharacterized protein LOC105846626 isoform X3 n=1 Tax=Hydra vulgaris TaxID=6087 RepID=UPI001F5F643D|nr:uncharacterized protein LOC105846626 [Hydra vulgaris]